MLKKEFRLRKQKDFENVFQKGFYFANDFLSLKITKNDLPISRFGFIVSKKVSKKAVQRNRIKRLLRESIRLKQKDLQTSFDAIFIVRAGTTEKNFKEVDLVMEKLLKRSKLLK